MSVQKIQVPRTNQLINAPFGAREPISSPITFLSKDSDEPEFQRGTATKPERADGYDGGENRDHAHNGMAAAQDSLAFSAFRNFEQAQVSGSGVRRSQLFRFLASQGIQII
jgi:hypothetical protein